jgi:hypothetical protein
MKANLFTLAPGALLSSTALLPIVGWNFIDVVVLFVAWVGGGALLAYLAG